MKLKTFVVAMALFVLISGSLLLYNQLKDSVQATEQIDAHNTEQSSSDTESQTPENEASSRIKAPDFTVTDAEGNQIKLSDMLGKPVVLNFWASWCPPCKGEMPEFDKLYKEVGSDIQFMMVDVVDGNRETKEKGAAYIAEQGYSFPVYFDMDLDAVTQYGIRAFPTSFFIDREGYIVTGVEGAINESKLRKGIGLIDGTEEATEN